MESRKPLKLRTQKRGTGSLPVGCVPTTFYGTLQIGKSKAMIRNDQN